MVTIATLKKAWLEQGLGDLSYDEVVPHELGNEGIITIYVDEDRQIQFQASNGVVICGAYYSDVRGSRERALIGLLDDIRLGFEPMSEDTAWGCDITLSSPLTTV